MSHLRSPRQVFAVVALVAALSWGSGTVAAALPQSARLHATVHPARAVDYATDVVIPGSRFTTRPTYDQ